MTKKKFWSDPYQTTLETTVTSVAGPCITLSETIFFAFSGGQESDMGTIAGQAVISAQKNGLEIVYTLPDNHVSAQTPTHCLVLFDICPQGGEVITYH